jgi:hypothetical protein
MLRAHLGADEVHIWCVSIATGARTGTFWTGLLPEDELASAERIRVASAKRPRTTHLSCP